MVHINTLTALAKPAASSPGSSSSLLDQEAPDLDRQYTETMAKLVRILGKSLRVRYELDLVGVVQMCAVNAIGTRG
jgi:hypothetical protein